MQNKVERLVEIFGSLQLAVLNRKARVASYNVAVSVNIGRTLGSATFTPSIGRRASTSRVQERPIRPEEDCGFTFLLPSRTRRTVPRRASGSMISTLKSKTLRHVCALLKAWGLK